MSVPSTGAPAPMPFLAVATWGEAFQLMLRHAGILLGQVLVLCGLTFVAGLLIGILYGLLGMPRGGAVAGQVIGAIIGLGISVNIWIGVGRLAIRSEPPSIAGLFLWGGRQWRMLGVSLLCFLVVFVPIAVVGFALLAIAGAPMRDAGSNPTAGAVFAILALLGSIWCIIAAARLSFVGSIVADDGPPGAIRQSWNLSRGRTLKLIGGILLTLLAIMIGEMLLLMPAFLLGRATQDSIYAGLVQSLGGAIGGIWMMAFASLAYAKLRGPAPA